MQEQQVSMTSSVAGAGLGGGVKRCFSCPKKVEKIKQLLEC